MEPGFAGIYFGNIYSVNWVAQIFQVQLNFVLV